MPFLNNIRENTPSSGSNLLPWQHAAIFRSGVVSSWYALFMPAKTPAEIVKRVYTDAVAAIAHPQAKQQTLGMSPRPPSTSTPAELTERLKSELGKWGPVIQELSIKPD